MKSTCKELLSLLFPILLIFFGASAVGSIERICLARHSLEALNGSVQALCFLQFFQLTCVVFANMTQVFIGEQLGSKESTKVGNTVWQMIWLSLLSMLIILPLSLIIDPIFFRATEQGEIANGYFKILISGNFLFPVGATLSSFFLAQGKKWTVVGCSLGAYVTHLLLNPLLILGFANIFPPLGAIGAAWSGLIAKLVFCVSLFLFFLNRFNRDQYWTHEWKIKLSSIFHCIRICAPRATGKAFTMFIGTAISYLMIAKGGNYLSVLSIGTTLTLLCSFLTESLIQSLSVIFSRYLGSKEYAKLWSSWRWGSLFALLVCTLLAIPFLIFPNMVLSLFFSKPLEGIEGQLLHSTIHWVWFWVFFSSLNAPFLAFLLAARDTVYYMILMSLTWITSYLPIYYCLYRLEWTADKFWFILIFDQLIFLSLNAWRVYRLGKPLRQDQAMEVA